MPSGLNYGTYHVATQKANANDSNDSNLLIDQDLHEGVLRQSPIPATSYIVCTQNAGHAVPGLDPPNLHLQGPKTSSRTGSDETANA